MYKFFQECPSGSPREIVNSHGASEAMDIAGEIFEITDKLPRRKDYGFTSQIRRSVLSISANIARPVKYHFVAPIEYIIYMG